MDYQPPPFFKRGPAPLALFSFYAALSVSLLVVDARFHTLELLRQGLSMFTHPLQQAAHAPAEIFGNAGNYFSSVTRLQDENAQMKHAQLDGATTLLRTAEADKQYSVRVKDLIKSGDVSANVEMKPGDVLIIPRSWF